MKMVTGKCPECNKDIAPGKDQAQFNRNLGLHKRSAHGYVSPKYHSALQYRQRRPALRSKADLLKQLAEARKKRWEDYRKTKASGPVFLSPRERRLAYGRSYRARQQKLRATQQNGTNASNAQACRLSECPECGARFYVVKGTQ